MQRKIRVGVIFGGMSEEHEVSIRSAESVMSHLDQDLYEVFPIKIEKTGAWVFQGVEDPLFSPQSLKKNFDVIFPVLHGPYGEDGTVQGLLELSGVPFVGADTLSSAMCMDKGVTKEMLKGAGLPTPKFLTLDSLDIEKVTETFSSFPLFVKPARLGSSIGISMVKAQDELCVALEESFKHDHRVVVEEGIKGREIEVSVLGNKDPIVSLPGEIIPTHEFYSYEAKYLDENGAKFVLPAKISDEEMKTLQDMAKKAYLVMRCEGMARVDFFLCEKRGLLVNEINTIPGFTSISLYPKLWELSGIGYSELLSKLIDLGIKRQSRAHSQIEKLQLVP